MDHNKSDHRRDKHLLNIDDFKIVKQLQFGGFGIVYEVKNINTDEKFAAKVLANHVDQDDNSNENEFLYKKMVNREIKCLIKCQNPTVIKFYGYSFVDFNKQKNITIFMDLAANGSLAELLNKIRRSILDIPYDNTTRQIILIGIAYGMKYLHQHHIIHRDLKPGNILLNDQLHPLITDFGLSKSYGTGFTKQSRQCGTYEYMAPEVLKGVKYNEKADVYSFGILIYEVVTELLPYPQLANGTLNPQLFTQKVLNENYRPEFTVPIKQSIQKLIKQCWSADPKERPTFEEIFQKLAYNNEDPFDEYFYGTDDDESDFNEYKYYLDDVDVDDVLFYVEDIDKSESENLSNELLKVNKKFEDEINSVIEKNKELIDENNKMKKVIADIRKENDDMKKEINNIKENKNMNEKFNNFNERLTKIERGLVCIQEQQISIKDYNSSPLLIKLSIISNLSNEKIKPYFLKIKALLLYFVKLKHDSAYPYIEIVSDNMDQSISAMQNEETVQIFSNITEILYKNRSFDTHEFNNIISQFNSISFEIQYPSSIFNELYQKILIIKNNLPQKIKISIFICQINTINDIFNGNEDISSLKFESTVEQICGKNGSFKNCLKLRRVILPIYLKIIGISSFEYTSIKQIIIPPTVKIIHSCAFKCCKLLESIELPPSVTDIGEGCFSLCKSLVKIKIPPLIVEIGRCTFFGCASLKFVEMTKSVRKINDNAFKDCISLREIKIPSNASLGKTVFPENIKIDNL